MTLRVTKIMYDGKIGNVFEYLAVEAPTGNFSHVYRGTVHTGILNIKSNPILFGKSLLEIDFKVVRLKFIT